MKIFKISIAFLLAVFILESSWALDAQRFKPLNSSQGGWTQYGAGIHETGTIEIGFFYNFVKNPLEFGDTQSRRLDDLLVDLHSFDILLSYNVTRSWSLLIEAPYNYATYFEDANSEIEEKRKNFGDVFVSSPVHLGHLGADFHLEFIPNFAFKSGDEKSFLGEAKFLWGLGLALDKVFGKSLWRANLFYQERERESLYNLEVGDFLKTGISYSYDFGKEGGWLWLSELNYELPVGVDRSDINQPLEVLSGLRYNSFKHPFIFNLGAGKGLNSGYGSPDYRIFGGVSYRPQKAKTSKLIPTEEKSRKNVVVIAPKPSLNQTQTQEGKTTIAEEPAEPQSEPKVEHPKEVSETESKILIQLEKVHFISGSDRLKFDSLSALKRLADLLKTYEKEIQVLAIDGHTDSQGDFNFNMGLSRRRARAVKSFLIERGISAQRLVTRGFGPSRPIDSNASQIGRYNNRRVEFVVLKLNSAKKIIIKNSNSRR